MRSASTTVTAASVALGLLAAAAPGAERNATNAAGSAPVTIVGPLAPNGGVKISGTATVDGTVAATQSGPWSVAQTGPWTVGQSGPWTVGQSGAWSVGQSGPWTVGLEGPASAALANIDAATSALRYDADGNLKVSITGGSAADPSVADHSPFGFSAHSSFTGTVDIPGAESRVTSYSFYSDHDMVAIFMHGGHNVLALRVPANQSFVGSFYHAILADNLQLQCLGGSTCTVMNSTAGY